MQRVVLYLIAWEIIVLMPPRSAAQDEPRIVEIQIASKDKRPALKPLDLRPNTATAVGIALKNDGDENLADVTAKLVQLVGEKKYRILAEASLKELEVRKSATLKFEPIKGGPKDGELVGSPPFKIQLHVDSAKKVTGFKRLEIDLEISIGEPSNYIIPEAKFTDTKAENNRLSILVKDGIPSAGPHQCPVQIVLGPELEPTKKGVHQRTLDEPKQEVELSVYPLKFAGKYAKGRVYLKADDYDRAFTYEVALGGTGTANLLQFVNKVGANMRLPRYMKPSATFAVPLELDGPLSDDYQVEVALDRTGEKKRFQALKPLVGLRQKKIFLTVSATNHLLVQTKVADWRPQFDTAGTTGPMWLRLQVFNLAKIDPKTNKPAAENLDVSAEPLPGQVKLEYDENAKALYVQVIQDDSAAEDIVFAGLPKEWEVGKPLGVEVKIRPRDEDQAPIQKVILFKGKAPEKEKDEIKTDDILATATVEPKDEKQWKWSFPVPAQSKAEPMQLSVQFTTATGVKSAKTETITFKPASDGKDAKTLATIKGVLKYGDNLLQPKQKVLLLDAKRNTLDTVETGPKGEFVFKKVPAGAYVIWSSPRYGTDVLVGHIAIEVKEGAKEIDAKTLSVLLK
jgi:hypothetical protein